MPSMNLKYRDIICLVLGVGRLRKHYEGGERTDKDELLNGKPLYRYPAAFSSDGITCMGVGTLDTTSELAPSSFGELYRGVPGQQAEVIVSPNGQYDVRLNVRMESVVPAAKADQK
ncbi:hypothetical protein [Bifidobacterium pseudocatenulatum]|uniref:hypothetical protein n=1 Tax=Bifidobacterium pseudocatenulatum TaxID=28026 RepID=UPI00242E8E78|nr:hypothetical protein [Bifidobacterium catenulatum]